MTMLDTSNTIGGPDYVQQYIDDMKNVSTNNQEVVITEGSPNTTPEEVKALFGLSLYMVCLTYTGQQRQGSQL